MYQPLVTVAIITYNSSKYVIEALESVKAQTYSNIELVVSDDASTDCTVELCKDWLETNKDRFVHARLITVERNTGIAANCNRAIKAAQGEWIKSLAGDDALLPDCIEMYMTYAEQHPDCSLLHSKAVRYNQTFELCNRVKEESPIFEPFTKKNVTVKQQFEALLWESFIDSPSLIGRIQVLVEVGMYDESIPLCEDWPMWIKLSKAGYRFTYLDIESVNYRLSLSSISNNYYKQTDRPIFSPFYTINRAVYRSILKNELKVIARFFIVYYYYLRKIYTLLHLNKRSNRIAFLLFRVLAKPYFIYKKVMLRQILG